MTRISDRSTEDNYRRGHDHRTLVTYGGCHFGCSQSFMGHHDLTASCLLSTCLGGLLLVCHLRKSPGWMILSCHPLTGCNRFFSILPSTVLPPSGFGPARRGVVTNPPFRGPPGPSGTIKPSYHFLSPQVPAPQGYCTGGSISDRHTVSSTSGMAISQDSPLAFHSPPVREQWEMFQSTVVNSSDMVDCSRTTVFKVVQLVLLRRAPKPRPSPQTTSSFKLDIVGHHPLFSAIRPPSLPKLFLDAVNL